MHTTLRRFALCLLILLFAGYAPLALAAMTCCAAPQPADAAAAPPCHEEAGGDAGSPGAHSLPSCCLTVACLKCATAAAALPASPQLHAIAAPLLYRLSMAEGAPASHPGYPLDHPPKSAA